MHTRGDNGLLLLKALLIAFAAALLYLLYKVGDSIPYAAEASSSSVPAAIINASPIVAAVTATGIIICKLIDALRPASGSGEEPINESLLGLPGFNALASFMGSLPRHLSSWSKFIKVSSRDVKDEQSSKESLPASE